MTMISTTNINMKQVLVNRTVAEAHYCHLGNSVHSFKLLS